MQEEREMKKIIEDGHILIKRKLKVDVCDDTVIPPGGSKILLTAVTEKVTDVLRDRMEAGRREALKE